MKRFSLIGFCRLRFCASANSVCVSYAGSNIRCFEVVAEHV
jgi:hypothetical protein